MSSDRFEELWNDYLEGELEEELLSELRQFLANDPELQKIAVDGFQTHRLLGLHAQDSDQRHEDFVRSTMAKLPAGETGFVRDVMRRLPSSGPTPENPRRFAPYLWIPSVAALLLFALLVGRQAWRANHNDAASHIAEITALNGAIQWTGAGGIVEPITQLNRKLDGGTLESLSADGWAELRFLDGSTVTVSGRSLLTISEQQQKVVRLRYGNVSADIAPQPSGRPMLVHTPSADLSVLGTRFNVDAQPEQTKLVVNEGLVRLRRRTDEREVDVPASYQVTASIEATDEQLLPIKRGEGVTSWTSDLKSDVVHGKWVAKSWTFARQLKAAVRDGRMSEREALVAYKKAASLDEQEGSLWATPGSMGSLVLLNASRSSSSPVILSSDARFRISGRIYGESNVEFGVTVSDLSGRFAGKYSVDVPKETLQTEGESFNLVITLEEFQPIMKNIDDFAGKELRDWWCVAEGKSAKLELTSVELLE